MQMFILGMVLIGVGFVVLYYGICQRNAIQGVVSEASIVFLLVFGLMDWKNNKYSISLMASGLVMVLAGVFL